MFGLDTSETVTREVNGFKVQIGLLSEGRYDELSVQHEEAIKPLRAHLADAHTKDGKFDFVASAHCGDCRNLEKAVQPVWRAIVREGLRGFEGAPPLETVPFEWAGETYAVLSDKVLDQLQLALRGRFIWNLSAQVLSVNTLDPKTVLSFLSSSGSRTVPTS